ncbi:uncharacterized protein VTP21DRAFT_7240 [Calcarisporiella thermophila]|uniref:uncharacterized protein n=1 Tax=Calcarisporiella thermophila TaxID=911321 RepID=UPI00374266E2
MADCNIYPSTKEAINYRYVFIFVNFLVENYYPYPLTSSQDFSYSGYKYGLELPPDNLPILERLSPRNSYDSLDDTSRIQAAIDRASLAQLDSKGFRGTVHLNPGIYHISHTLFINASGIVLEGESTGGTRIFTNLSDAENLPFIVNVQGAGHSWLRSTKARVLDDYVPVGAQSLRIEKVWIFRPGHTIQVAITTNKEWVQSLSMDKIPLKKADSHEWVPMQFTVFRKVVFVDIFRGEIHLDAPLTMSISSQFGGAYVQRYRNRRISHVGIQDLEFICPFNEGREAKEFPNVPPGRDYRFAQEMFQNYVAQFENVEHSWMRNVNSSWFHNFVSLAPGSKHITIMNCHHRYPNQRAFYSGQSTYKVDGQLILFTHCSSDNAFHNWAFMGRVPGPNVVHRCSATGTGDSGPHMRWSTGQLYDNVMFNGTLLIQNRGQSGTGHGWAGANSVVWNSQVSGGIVVQRPPTAQNFAIGSTNKTSKRMVTTADWGWWESPGRPVWPESLYEAQLEERKRRYGIL